MISNLELKNLPFVDEIPEADQKRIPWVRDGDCLSGASTKYGNDGILNGAGVGIQSNVVRLLENGETTRLKVNTLVESVNNINEALEIGANTEVIAQISKNKENIEILQVHMQFAEENIGDLETDTTFLKEDVGVYDPLVDDYYRTIRGNLVWMKNEMGSYPGQDINGQSKPGAVATGMKRRIIDNSSAIVAQGVRLKDLEDKYQDSDVGSLNIRVQEIRQELGERTLATNDSIYVRLNNSEAYDAANTTTINEIKTAIGFSSGQSINSRVGNLEVRATATDQTLKAPITGLVPRVTVIETELGADDVPMSIKGRLKIVIEDLDALEFIVGADSSSGLRGDVAWLTQKIGTDISPAPESISGKLAAVTTLANSNASKIQDLQAEIGNNTTGLKGSVLKLNSQMNGTDPNGTTIETRGVIRSIRNLETQQASNISEAPRDGKTYGRQNAAWIAIQGSNTAAQIAALETAVVDLKAKDEAQDLVSTGLRSDITRIDATLVTESSKIATAQSDITALKAKDTSLDADIVALGGRIDAVKTTADANTGSIIALQTSTGEIKTTADSAKTKSDTNAGEIATMKLAMIAEAPQDGRAYVRVNKSWVLLETYLTP